MKDSKLIWAAMLLFALSLATFNGTNAQTNSSAVRQANVNTQGSSYLAAVDLDNNGHKNKHKNTTKATKTTNVTLSYTSGLPVGVGHLLYVEFMQNGSVVYTFQNYQIDGATIPQGNYIIVLHISNPLEYTTYSTLCTATNWYGCANYYYATYLVQDLAADLTTSTTLNFYSATYNCPSGGGPQ